MGVASDSPTPCSSISGPPLTSWPIKPALPRMVASSLTVGRTRSSARDGDGLAASAMWTTGAPATGVAEHPASTAHALNAAIADRVERVIVWGHLLFRLVGRGVRGQGGNERLLRHLHPTDGLHALLAFFLLLQQLALARDVAAVTLR